MYAYLAEVDFLAKLHIYHTVIVRDNARVVKQAVIWKHGEHLYFYITSFLGLFQLSIYTAFYIVLLTLIHILCGLCEYLHILLTKCCWRLAC